MIEKGAPGGADGSQELERSEGVVSRRRRGGKRRSGRRSWGVLFFLALVGLLAGASGLAWQYIKRYTNLLRPEADSLALQLVAETESAFSGSALSGRGTLLSRQKRMTSVGEVYTFRWAGEDETSLILAEKELEERWRALHPKVQAVSLYPEDPTAGEKIHMVAGLPRQPLVEVFLGRKESESSASQEKERSTTDKREEHSSLEQEPGSQTSALPPSPPRQPEEKKLPGGPLSPRGRLAIIVDDIGGSLEILEQLLSIEVPLTFSVLPGQPYTRTAVERIREAGAELMLHMPMEPLEPAKNPGPGALFVRMPEDEIRSRFVRALAEVPGARGFNNHMGSAFTADRSGMRVVLEAARERGLFFVDSLTGSRSVGLKLAEELGVPAAGRTLFLDHAADERAVEAQLWSLAKAAETHGSALGIAHPHPETVAAFLRVLPQIQQAGYEFVPVMEVLR